MIKVLHLVEHFHVGGLEKVITQLLTYAPQQINPGICVLGYSGYFAEQVERSGLSITHLNNGNRFNRKNFRLSIKLMTQIFSLLLRTRPDVVHCHDMAGWYFGTIASMLVPKRIPIVYTRHGSFSGLTRTIRYKAKILSKFTDRIIAVSEDVKNEWISKINISPVKINTVLNGVDTDLFSKRSNPDLKKELGLTDQNFITGTVTRFFAVKNIEMQIEMVSRLKTQIPELRHIIVAPIGERGKKFKDIIKKRGLDKYIILAGYREDVPDMLSLFDIFILTSLSEGTPVSILEAMASGTPVISSRVGGIPKLVSNGQNGFLFDVDDLDGLCDNIYRLRNNSELRNTLSRNSRKAAENFSIKNTCKHYEKIYNEILT